ncbi:hypothetical protein MMPV_008906 [Pyropia vietnamensis]
MGAPNDTTPTALAAAYMAARAAGAVAPIADLVTPTVTMESQRDGTIQGMPALTAYCQSKGPAPGTWGDPVPVGSPADGRVRVDGVVTWLGVRMHVAAVFGCEGGRIAWIGVGRSGWKGLAV